MDENIKNSLKVVVEYMTDEWMKYMNPQTVIYKKRSTGEVIRLCQLKSYLDKNDSSVYAYFEALLFAASKMIQKKVQNDE